MGDSLRAGHLLCPCSFQGTTYSPGQQSQGFIFLNKPQSFKESVATAAAPTTVSPRQSAHR